MSETTDLEKTYLENWPEELRRLSFATALTPLSEPEREALIADWYALNGEGNGGDPSVLDSLASRVQGLIDQFPHGAFVKLGSRSPKDSWAAQTENFRVVSADTAIAWLTESERITDDLQVRDYRPYLAVREWKSIPPPEEWRVFVKSRRIAGVSQYNYFESYPLLPSIVPVVRSAIDWFWPQLREALPLDDLIVDLWIHGRRQANATVWEAKVIEINPWGFWTDPCLMSWKDDSWQTADPYEIRVKL